MKRPNFFIIGAPKCGTTSLVSWLARHPNIFISPIKEPHYFYTDGNRNFVNIRDRNKYEKLFSTATPNHYAIGEASVFYLFSKKAVIGILQSFPDARFIVMLRNPVDMAVSLHWQEVFSENEHITEFQKAWSLQEMRSQGKMVKRTCKEPKHLLYGQVCKLGEQLERLYMNASRENVLVVFLDDIIADPKTSYKSVLRFLNVDDSFVTDLAPQNIAKSSRSKMLRKWLEFAGFLKISIGIRANTGLLEPLWKVNNLVGTKPPISEDFKKRLKQYFKCDVKKLELLTGRDLSHWS